MDEQQLKTIEKKIDELIALCDQLYRENQSLKNNQEKWHHERAQLREKSELARSRVEAMIARLKSLEQET